METVILNSKQSVLLNKHIFMNFDEALILLLDTLDLSQALSIGLFFSLIYRRKKSNLLYLGIFLIVIGLSSLITIFEQLSALYSGDEVLEYPFNLYLIIPCFLYLYVQKASILKENKNAYLLFIPGILDIIIGCSILYFSNNYSIIQESIPYMLYQILSIIYLPIVIILILLKIRKNSNLLKQQYSSVENRELKWVGFMGVIILAYLSIFPLILYYSTSFIFLLTDTIFWLFITYWSAYNGLLQQTSKNLIALPNSKPSSNKLEEIEKDNLPQIEISTINLSTKPIIDSEKHKQIFAEIDTLVKNDALFLNPELTISDIATQINEHPRLISTTINDMSGSNFNNYINLFRVEYAKKLLLSDRSKTINIESIGQESGFKSNSSFYSAFKKNMNLTPLQFIKANQNSKAS